MLLSGLLGLITSILPQGMKMFQNWQDNKHELEMFNAQVEANKLQHIQKLEEINAEADIKESLAVYSAYQPQTNYPKTGINWIDGYGAFIIVTVSALNSTVRPMIAYYIVGIYIAVRYASTLPWSDTDSDILMLVLGHFFGNRAMKYVTNRRDNAA